MSTHMHTHMCTWRDTNSLRIENEEPMNLEWYMLGVAPPLLCTFYVGVYSIVWGFSTLLHSQNFVITGLLDTPQSYERP